MYVWKKDITITYVPSTWCFVWSAICNGGTGVSKLFQAGTKLETVTAVIVYKTCSTAVPETAK